jgi:hypothetical protein
MHPVTDMSAVASEIFQVLRRYNYSVTFFDDQLARVMEPADARNFFANISKKRKDGKQEPAVLSPHLMVSLNDKDDDSSISLLYGKSVHINSIYGLMQTLRITATKYNMIFVPSQYFKEINPKDPEVSAMAESNTRGYRMQVIEGMYGTSKSSYLRFDNAKMIVRHKNRVDDSRIGARGRFVEAIFIQNDLGERLLFPSPDLAAARAMTQHVSSGGHFQDDLGGQILQMADEYGKLGTCARYVQANTGTLAEGAQLVREACRAKMLELRKTFQRLYRPHTYATEGAALMAKARLLNETGGPIDEARIDELRVLLNDAEFPHAVYECAHKAMLTHGNKPVTERAISRVRAVKPIMPLAENHPAIQAHLRWLDSFRVDEDVPESFKTHQFKKKDAESESETDTESETDDAESENKPAELDERVDDKEDQWKRDRHDELAKEVSQKHDEERRAKGKAAADKWVKTTPLKERGLFEFEQSGDQDYDDHYESGLQEADDNFDAKEFVHSPQMQEVLGGRDPHGDGENVLDEDEVIDALQNYLRHLSSITDVDGDLLTLAERVFDQACVALNDLGFEVETHQPIAEMDGPLDMMDDPSDMMAEDLTREDILLPSNTPRPGDTLFRQVGKAAEKTPQGYRPLGKKDIA